MKWHKYAVSLSAIVFTVTVLTSCGGGSNSTGTILQSITVTPTNPTLTKGSSQQFTAVGYFSNNTSQDITTTVTWGSSNSTVAKVSDVSGSKGLVTAVTQGTTNITATMNAVSGDTQLNSSAFGFADISQLGIPPWYYQHPVVAINNQSMVLVAYEQEGTLLTKFYDGKSWPPSWQILDPGAWNFSPWSANDHQLVMNESGSAGLIYLTGSYSIGFSYFNGTTWSYNQTIEGYIRNSFTQPGESRTPIIGIDSSGTVYVAYQKSVNNVPEYVLCIARFDANGLIDITEFPEYPWNVYLSVSANDQVMVLNSFTGSRTFDGTTWGQLKPFLPNNNTGPAYLKLSNSGSAEFITLQDNIMYFHYDGTSWGPGLRIDDNSTSSGNGAAASDGSGNIMVAYPGSAANAVSQIKTNFFNGTTWGPAIAIDDPALFELNEKVFVDRIGNFVVVYSKDDPNGVYANYFSNGSWNKAIKLDEVYGVLDPAVAMNDNGDLVIVSDWWENLNLYSRFYAFLP